MTILLEIVFKAGDLIAAGFEGRDELEDPLADALEESGLGEITGGGGGLGVSNIDVEVEDQDSVAPALELIRDVLRSLGAPASTIINQYEPFERAYRLDVDADSS